MHLKLNICLNLFGFQGKVPRNEYGNVELFQPCMLPPGTRHIQSEFLILRDKCQFYCTLEDAALIFLRW